MVNKQPEALRLADELEKLTPFSLRRDLEPTLQAAAELRRLHAENDDFRAACDHLTRENAEQIGEIVMLKEQRDELLEAMKRIAMAAEAAVCNVEWIAHHARAAISKAGGAA